MKKFLSIILMSAVMVGFTVSTASADSASKGQKIYLKKLKKYCGYNGAEMAAKHSQEEWEAAKDTLEAEIKNICPTVPEVKSKYHKKLYDFFYKYANDSGEVPAC